MLFDNRDFVLNGKLPADNHRLLIRSYDDAKLHTAVVSRIHGVSGLNHLLQCSRFRFRGCHGKFVCAYPSRVTP